MAIFFPSDAKAKDAPGGPEQQVLDALKKQLDDSWKVIHNLYIAKHDKQLRGEADIVLIRHGVIILLEVKGGKIGRDKKRKWSQNGRELKCPITQATGNFETIKKYTREASGRFAMADWSCIFPQSVFQEKSIEWRPDQMFDVSTMRSGIGRALERLHDRILGEQLPRLGPTARLDDKSTDKLIHILRPEVDGRLTNAILIDLAELEVENLEKEQIDSLEIITSNQRVLLTGGAGSGKTALGYLACIEKLKASHDARVAFVCCSEHLAKDLRTRAKKSSYADRFDVHSLSDLTRHFWERIVERRRSFTVIGHGGFAHTGFLESWILGVPVDFSDLKLAYERLVKLLEDGQAERARVDLSSVYSSSPICDVPLNLEGNQYDFVVVDEAQDFMFSKPELCYLSLVIKGGLSKGQVLWIQDIYQSIRPFFMQYEADSMPTFVPEDLGYVKCPLPPKNYRNPPGVAKIATLLNRDQPMKSLRTATLAPDFEIVDCSGGRIGDALDELLYRLRSEGVAARDVAIITADGQDDSHFATGSLHAGFRVIKVPASHEDEVLAENSDVIRAFNLIEAKGREFPVVILCDVPMMENDFDRNFMLVAVTRAKAKLYVLCGDERKKALSDVINSKQ